VAKLVGADPLIGATLGIDGQGSLGRFIDDLPDRLGRNWGSGVPIMADKEGVAGCRCGCGAAGLHVSLYGGLRFRA